MPVTALDPKTALIVIDLQKGIAAMVAPEVLDPIVARSRALADAFRAKGLPVVLVNAAGVAPGRSERGPRITQLPPGFDELLESLGAQPGDIRITKRTWGAFRDTDLEAQLKARGVTQVVVTGVATSAGVESTARAAHEAGFNVTLATDAMSDMSPEAHAHTVGYIFPRLGETGATDEILALLG